LRPRLILYIQNFILSEYPGPLSVEFCLHLRNVDLIKIGFRFQRQGRCYTGTLSCSRTAAHVAYGGVADTSPPIARPATSRFFVPDTSPIISIPLKLSGNNL
jgi:hypothetical protein